MCAAERMCRRRTAWRRALRSALRRFRAMARAAGQHHLLAPPPVERLEQQVQPQQQPQRLRGCAFAAGGVPTQRAARDVQIDDEHVEAPLAKLRTRRQQRHAAAQQQQQQH
jgi:hypothetical protein